MGHTPRAAHEETVKGSQRRSNSKGDYKGTGSGPLIGHTKGVELGQGFVSMGLAADLNFKEALLPPDFSGASSRPTRGPGPRALPTTMGSVSNQQFAGGCTKAAEKAPEEAPEDAARAADEPQLLHGAGICKWFNVRMGFGFLSMTARAGVALDPPVDVFVHQSKLHMEGFRSLKEGEAVEFTFKKSSKGLESIRVTGPGGVFCIGSEWQPKGKSMQKRRSKRDGCYNCGGLDHHAKECKLPPQPKKCHFCQSITIWWPRAP